ncbi:MAG: glycosyltransferase family 4 protein [Candidatus Omnitrophota bacterium]
MNILFLANHLNIGGITSYIFSLARGLKRKGHNVYVASSGGDCLTRFTQEGIIFIPVPLKTKSEINIFKIGISFFKLLKEIREKQVQIVHTNSRVTQVLGDFLKRKTGVSHVTTWHGFFEPRWSRKKFPCWADKVIAISEQVKEHLLNEFNARPENIRLIHNGIDLDKVKLKEPLGRREVKNKLGLQEGPVIGIIARLSDVKGHVYLIRAMKNILKDFPDAQLLIVGEGRMEKELVSLVEELKIKSNVFFIPRHQNIAELLYIMDIFVMPSLKEGLGLGLMEAMAGAKAVVGSAVGGIKTLIRDKENGLLVAPQDANGLASAIRELLNDPARAAVMGNNARIFITRKFSLDEMLDKTEEVYKECLSEKG